MSGPERRRLARIPLRCAVVVREKRATWSAETADVGARGCRLTLGQPVSRGALLQLRFDAGPGAEPLEAVGQVVWTAKGDALEAGVAFVSAPRAGARVSNWIDALAVAQLRRAARVGAGALGTLAEAVLRLAAAPQGALSARAVAAARVAEREGRVAEVPGGGDGLLALAALLADGAVTLGATRGDAQAWQRAFALPPAPEPAPAGVPSPALPAPPALALVPPPPEVPAATPRSEVPAATPPPLPPLPDARSARVAALIAESLLEEGEGAPEGDGARVA